MVFKNEYGAPKKCEHVNKFWISWLPTRRLSMCESSASSYMKASCMRVSYEGFILWNFPIQVHLSYKRYTFQLVNSSESNDWSQMKFIQWISNMLTWDLLCNPPICWLNSNHSRAFIQFVNMLTWKALCNPLICKLETLKLRAFNKGPL